MKVPTDEEAERMEEAARSRGKREQVMKEREAREAAEAAEKKSQAHEVELHKLLDFHSGMLTFWRRGISCAGSMLSISMARMFHGGLSWGSRGFGSTHAASSHFASGLFFPHMDGY